jgi:hypothetical protein
MKEVMVKIKWMDGDAFQIFKKKNYSWHLCTKSSLAKNNFFWRFVSRRRRRSSILFWLGVFSENVNHVHKRKKLKRECQLS